MKIILSRKGFDSGSGGFPNPILPSGQLCMLPIPERTSGVRYRDIQIDDESLPRQMKPNMGSMLSQLTGRKISPMRCAHLDPDLKDSHLPRLPGWKPAFGQRGAALGHLQRQGVDCGDLFLFFGWFRETEVVGIGRRERLCYVKDAPDLHVLFGWLQVGAVIDFAHGTDCPDWAASHPHRQTSYLQDAVKSGNVLYVASSCLKLFGCDTHHSGGGLFPKFIPRLQLSKPNGLRSTWLLPQWFMPSHERKPLTYHSDMNRWQQQPDGVLLRTVGRGQEFVLDGDDYPESRAWLRGLFDF